MSEKILSAVGQLASAVVANPAANQCFGANCPGKWGWSSPYIGAVISAPAPARPLRYIINTSAAADRIGGNERIATTGFFPRGSQFGGAVENVGPRA
jgi:hypothetical protein